MATPATLAQDLRDAGMVVRQVDATLGGTSVEVDWTPTTGATVRRLLARAHRPGLGFDWSATQLTETTGRVRMTVPAAARIKFELEGQLDQVVTVYVPHTVHYSGHRTGRVVALATMSGQPDGPYYLVLEAECQTVLIELGAVMSWEPQTDRAPTA